MLTFCIPWLYLLSSLMTELATRSSEEDIYKACHQKHDLHFSNLDMVSMCIWVLKNSFDVYNKGTDFGISFCCQESSCLHGKGAVWGEARYCYHYYKKRL